MKTTARTALQGASARPASSRSAPMFAQTLVDQAHRVPDRQRAILARAMRIDRRVAITDGDPAREATERRHDLDAPRLELAELALDPVRAVAGERAELALLANARIVGKLDLEA